MRFDNLANAFSIRYAVAPAPTDGGDYSGFHFHIEFHPPLRKPNLLKFLAGRKSAAVISSATRHRIESRGAARAIQRPLQTNMSDIRELLGPV